MNKKPRPRSILSLFVVLVFTVTTIGADALPALAAFQEVSEVKLPAGAKTFLTLPPELGTIESIHFGKGPTFIHLQTAHGDYSAQKKIQAVLHHLRENYGFKHLLVEGSAFKLKPELLRIFPDRMDLTMEIADALTKKSIVKGEELFLLEAREAEAYGIEEINSYRSNGKALVAVLKDREEAERRLRRLGLEIEKDGHRILNPRLRDFLKSEERFEEQKLPLPSWLAFLKREAKRVLKVDLMDPLNQIDWPMLLRIYKLEEFESKIDPAALEKERVEFLSQVASAFGHRHSESSTLTSSVARAKNLRDPSAPSGPQDDTYSQIQNLLSSPLSPHPLPYPDTTRLFEAMIASLPRDFDYSAYPNVCRFIGHLILQSEIQPERLTDEIDRLSRIIASKLAKKREERKFLLAFRRFFLLKKLFHLELTAKEYDELASLSLRAPGPRHCEDTKCPKQSDALRHPEAAVGRRRISQIASAFAGTLPRNDKLLRHALAFYRLAKLRDTHLLRNVEARLREKGIDKAIVITGGFHAKPFQDFFVGRGYSYALVTPKISAEDDSGLREGRQAYLDLMLKTLPHPVTRSTYASPYFLTSTRSEIRRLGFDPRSALKAMRTTTNGVFRESRATFRRSETRIEKKEWPTRPDEMGGDPSQNAINLTNYLLALLENLEDLVEFEIWAKVRDAEELRQLSWGGWLGYDIRLPLVTLRGAIHMMGESANPAKVSEYYWMTQRQLKELKEGLSLFAALIESEDLSSQTQQRSRNLGTKEDPIPYPAVSLVMLHKAFVEHPQAEANWKTFKEGAGLMIQGLKDLERHLETLKDQHGLSSRAEVRNKLDIPEELAPVDTTSLPRYLDIGRVEKDDRLLKSIYETGEGLPPQVKDLLEDPGAYDWNGDFFQFTAAVLSAYYRGKRERERPKSADGKPAGEGTYSFKQYQRDLFGGLFNFLTRVAWIRSGVDPESAGAQSILNVFPSESDAPIKGIGMGHRGYSYEAMREASSDFERILKSSGAARDIVLRFFRELTHQALEDFRYRSNFQAVDGVIIAGMGDQNEYGGLHVLERNLINASVLGEVIPEAERMEIIQAVLREQSPLYLTATTLPFRLNFPLVSNLRVPEKLAEKLVENMLRVINADLREDLQWYVNDFHRNLSAAQAQGITEERGAIDPEAVWKNFRSKLEKALAERQPLGNPPRAEVRGKKNFLLWGLVAISVILHLTAIVILTKSNPSKLFRLFSWVSTALYVLLGFLLVKEYFDKSQQGPDEDDAGDGTDGSSRAEVRQGKLSAFSYQPSAKEVASAESGKLRADSLVYRAEVRGKGGLLVLDKVFPGSFDVLKDFLNQALTQIFALVNWNDSRPAIGVAVKGMASFLADLLKSKLTQDSDDLGGLQGGQATQGNSAGDFDFVQPDKLKGLRGFFLGFKTKVDRFLDSFHQRGHILSLRMAASKSGNGSHQHSVFVFFDQDNVLSRFRFHAWNSNTALLPRQAARAEVRSSEGTRKKRGTNLTTERIRAAVAVRKTGGQTVVRLEEILKDLGVTYSALDKFWRRREETAAGYGIQRGDELTLAKVEQAVADQREKGQDTIFLDEIRVYLRAKRAAMSRLFKRSKVTMEQLGITSRQGGIHASKASEDRKWLAFVENFSPRKKEVLVGIILEKLKAKELDVERAYVLIEAVALGKTSPAGLDIKVAMDLGTDPLTVREKLIGRKGRVVGRKGIYQIMSERILRFYDNTRGYADLVEQYGHSPDLARRIDEDPKADLKLRDFLVMLARSSEEALPVLQVTRVSPEGRKRRIALTRDEKMKVLEAKFLRTHSSYASLAARMAEILGGPDPVQVTPTAIGRFFKGTEDRTYRVEGAVNVLRRFFSQEKQLFGAVIDTEEIPHELVPESYHNYLQLTREILWGRPPTREIISRLKLFAGEYGPVVEAFRSASVYASKKSYPVSKLLLRTAPQFLSQLGLSFENLFVTEAIRGAVSPLNDRGLEIFFEALLFGARHSKVNPEEFSRVIVRLHRASLGKAEEGRVLEVVRQVSLTKDKKARQTGLHTYARQVYATAASQFFPHLKISGLIAHTYDEIKVLEEERLVRERRIEDLWQSFTDDDIRWVIFARPSETRTGTRYMIGIFTDESGRRIIWDAKRLDFEEMAQTARIAVRKAARDYVEKEEDYKGPRAVFSTFAITYVDTAMRSLWRNHIGRMRRMGIPLDPKVEDEEGEGTLLAALEAPPVEPSEVESRLDDGEQEALNQIRAAVEEMTSRERAVFQLHHALKDTAESERFTKISGILFERGITDKKISRHRVWRLYQQALKKVHKRIFDQTGDYWSRYVHALDESDEPRPLMRRVERRKILISPDIQVRKQYLGVEKSKDKSSIQLKTKETRLENGLYLEGYDDFYGKDMIVSLAKAEPGTEGSVILTLNVSLERIGNLVAVHQIEVKHGVVIAVHLIRRISRPRRLKGPRPKARRSEVRGEDKSVGTKHGPEVTVRGDSANPGFVWVGDGVREVRVSAVDSEEIEAVKRQFLNQEMRVLEAFGMESLGVRFLPHVVSGNSSPKLGFGMWWPGGGTFSPSVTSALSDLRFKVDGGVIRASVDPHDAGYYWIESDRRRRKVSVEDFYEIDQGFRFVLSPDQGTGKANDEDSGVKATQILDELRNINIDSLRPDQPMRPIAFPEEDKPITRQMISLLYSLSSALREGPPPGLSDKEFKNFLHFVSWVGKKMAFANLHERIFLVIWRALEKNPSHRRILIESLSSENKLSLERLLFDSYLLLLSSKSLPRPSTEEVQRVMDHFVRHEDINPGYRGAVLAALAERTGKGDFSAEELDLLLEGIKGGTTGDPRSGLIERVLFRRRDLVERLIERFPIDLGLGADQVVVLRSYKEGLEKLFAREPVLKSLLLNSRNLTSLVQMMTVLRQIYGFGNAYNLRAPPFERVLAERRYFQIAPQIYLAPDPSFRRHFLFKMQEGGKVEFVIQIKIPGNPNDRPGHYLVEKENVDIPAELLRLAPDAPFQKPIALLKLPDDYYDLAYDRRRIVFDEEQDLRPFQLALFEYSLDGNRLSDFDPEDLPRDREGLARKVLGMAALVHHLGYRGWTPEGRDLHSENFILRVTESGFEIQVVDFEAYNPLSSDPKLRANEITRDLENVVETSSGVRGLSLLLQMPVERLEQIYWDEKEKLKHTRDKSHNADQINDQETGKSGARSEVRNKKGPGKDKFTGFEAAALLVFARHMAGLLDLPAARDVIDGKLTSLVEDYWSRAFKFPVTLERLAGYVLQGSPKGVQEAIMDAMHAAYVVFVIYWIYEQSNRANEMIKRYNRLFGKMRRKQKKINRTLDQQAPSLEEKIGEAELEKAFQEYNDRVNQLIGRFRASSELNEMFREDFNVLAKKTQSALELTGTELAAVKAGVKRLIGQHLPRLLELRRVMLAIIREMDDFEQWIKTSDPGSDPQGRSEVRGTSHFEETGKQPGGKTRAFVLVGKTAYKVAVLRSGNELRIAIRRGGSPLRFRKAEDGGQDVEELAGAIAENVNNLLSGESPPDLEAFDLAIDVALESVPQRVVEKAAPPITPAERKPGFKPIPAEPVKEDHLQVSLPSVPPQEEAPREASQEERLKILILTIFASWDIDRYSFQPREVVSALGRGGSSGIDRHIGSDVKEAYGKRWIGLLNRREGSYEITDKGASYAADILAGEIFTELGRQDEITAVLGREDIDAFVGKALEIRKFRRELTQPISGKILELRERAREPQPAEAASPSPKPTPGPPAARAMPEKETRVEAPVPPEGGLPKEVPAVREPVTPGRIRIEGEDLLPENDIPPVFIEIIISFLLEGRGVSPVWFTASDVGNHPLFKRSETNVQRYIKKNTGRYFEVRQRNETITRKIRGPRIGLTLTKIGRRIAARILTHQLYHELRERGDYGEMKESLGTEGALNQATTQRIREFLEKSMRDRGVEGSEPLLQEVVRLVRGDREGRRAPHYWMGVTAPNLWKRQIPLYYVKIHADILRAVDELETNKEEVTALAIWRRLETKRPLHVILRHLQDEKIVLAPGDEGSADLGPYTVTEDDFSPFKTESDTQGSEGEWPLVAAEILIARLLEKGGIDLRGFRPEDLRGGGGFSGAQTAGYKLIRHAEQGPHPYIGSGTDRPGGKLFVTQRGRKLAAWILVHRIFHDLNQNPDYEALRKKGQDEGVLKQWVSGWVTQAMDGIGIKGIDVVTQKVLELESRQSKLPWRPRVVPGLTALNLYGEMHNGQRVDMRARILRAVDAVEYRQGKRAEEKPVSVSEILEEFGRRGERPPTSQWLRKHLEGAGIPFSRRRTKREGSERTNQASRRAEVRKMEGWISGGNASVGGSTSREEQRNRLPQQRIPKRPFPSTDPVGSFHSSSFRLKPEQPKVENQEKYTSRDKNGQMEPLLAEEIPSQKRRGIHGDQVDKHLRRILALLWRKNALRAEVRSEETRRSVVLPYKKGEAFQVGDLMAQLSDIRLKAKKVKLRLRAPQSKWILSEDRFDELSTQDRLHEPRVRTGRKRDVQIIVKESDAGPGSGKRIMVTASQDLAQAVILKVLRVDSVTQTAWIEIEAPSSVSIDERPVTLDLRAADSEILKVIEGEVREKILPHLAKLQEKLVFVQSQIPWIGALLDFEKSEIEGSLGAPDIGKILIALFKLSERLGRLPSVDQIEFQQELKEILKLNLENEVTGKILHLSSGAKVARKTLKLKAAEEFLSQAEKLIREGKGGERANQIGAPVIIVQYNRIADRCLFDLKDPGLAEAALDRARELAGDGEQFSFGVPHLVKRYGWIQKSPKYRGDLTGQKRIESKITELEKRFRLGRTEEIPVSEPATPEEFIQKILLLFERGEAKKAQELIKNLRSEAEKLTRDQEPPKTNVASIYRGLAEALYKRKDLDRTAFVLMQAWRTIEDEKSVLPLDTEITPFFNLHVSLVVSLIQSGKKSFYLPSQLSKQAVRLASLYPGKVISDREHIQALFRSLIQLMKRYGLNDQAGKSFIYFVKRLGNDPGYKALLDEQDLKDADSLLKSEPEARLDGKREAQEVYALLAQGKLSEAAEKLRKLPELVASTGLRGDPVARLIGACLALAHSYREQPKFGLARDAAGIAAKLLEVNGPDPRLEQRAKEVVVEYHLLVKANLDELDDLQGAAINLSEAAKIFQSHKREWRMKGQLGFLFFYLVTLMERLHEANQPTEMAEWASLGSKLIEEFPLDSRLLSRDRGRFQELTRWLEEQQEPPDEGEAEGMDSNARSEVRSEGTRLKERLKESDEELVRGTRVYVESLKGLMGTVIRMGEERFRLVTEGVEMAEEAIEAHRSKIEAEVERILEKILIHALRERDRRVARFEEFRDKAALLIQKALGVTLDSLHRIEKRFSRLKIQDEAVRSLKQAIQPSKDASKTMEGAENGVQWLIQNTQDLIQAVNVEYDRFLDFYRSLFPFRLGKKEEEEFEHSVAALIRLLVARHGFDLEPKKAKQFLRELARKGTRPSEFVEAAKDPQSRSSSFLKERLLDPKSLHDLVNYSGRSVLEIGAMILGGESSESFDREGLEQIKRDLSTGQTVDLDQSVRGKTVLVIGFGPEVTELLEMADLFQTAQRVVGIESNRNHVAKAQQKQQDASGRIQVKHGKAEDLREVGTGEAGVYYAGRVLSIEVPGVDIDESFKEMSRVLADGGIAILSGSVFFAEDESDETKVRDYLGRYGLKMIKQYGLFTYVLERVPRSELREPAPLSRAEVREREESEAGEEKKPPERKTNTLSTPGRHRKADAYLISGISEGKFGSVEQIVDLGIGATWILPAAGEGSKAVFGYYSPAFVELALKLMVVFDESIRLIGVDNDGSAILGNINFLRDRADLRKIIDLVVGGFEKPLELSKEKPVDLILLRNILTHYTPAEAKEARDWLRRGLREGGHLSEGNEVAFLISKRKDDHWLPVELNVDLSPFLQGRRDAEAWRAAWDHPWPTFGRVPQAVEVVQRVWGDLEKDGEASNYTAAMDRFKTALTDDGFAWSDDGNFLHINLGQNGKEMPSNSSRAEVRNGEKVYSVAEISEALEKTGNFSGMIAGRKGERIQVVAQKGGDQVASLEVELAPEGGGSPIEEVTANVRLFRWVSKFGFYRDLPFSDHHKKVLQSDTFFKEGKNQLLELAPPLVEQMAEDLGEGVHPRIVVNLPFILIPQFPELPENQEGSSTQKLQNLIRYFLRLLNIVKALDIHQVWFIGKSGEVVSSWETWSTHALHNNLPALRGFVTILGERINQGADAEELQSVSRNLQDTFGVLRDNFQFLRLAEREALVEHLKTQRAKLAQDLGRKENPAISTNLTTLFFHHAFVEHKRAARNLEALKEIVRRLEKTLPEMEKAVKEIASSATRSEVRKEERGKGERGEVKGGEAGLSWTERVMAVNFLGGILPLEAMMRMVARAKEKLRPIVRALSRRVTHGKGWKRGQPPFGGQANAPAARRQKPFFKAAPPSVPVREQNLNLNDPTAELQLLRSA